MLICIASLYVVSFFLVLIGKKIRFPLLTFVILISLLLAQTNVNKDNFKYYALDETTKSSYKQLPIRQYIYNWIDSRKDKIIDYSSSGKKFPIFFVSSEGGGSRAGLWSLLIHSSLQEKTKGKYYSDHLFSMTGASGGNVGNSLFFTIEQSSKQFFYKKKYKSKNKLYVFKASDFYSENFLSSSIIGLFGRDLFNNIININGINNRGEILQNEWNQQYQKVFKDSIQFLDKDVLLLYKEEFNSNFVPPLLFLNSTHAQTGKYSIISPVDFSKEPSFSGYYNFFKELHTKKGSNASIKLSEAMRINAAFPYITPTGEIKNIGNFGDAGYYDNIGGTVTLNLVQIFNEVMKDTNFFKIKDKIDIRKLLINYSYKPGEDKFRYVPQLSAPINILLKARGGHTQEQISKLSPIKLSLQTTFIDSNTLFKTNLGKKARKFIKNDSIANKKIEPVLPLGRYLSGTAIKSMEAYLISKSFDRKLDSVVN